MYIHTYYIPWPARESPRPLSITPDTLDFMQERLPMTLLPALGSSIINVSSLNMIRLFEQLRGWLTSYPSTALVAMTT